MVKKLFLLLFGVLFFEGTVQPARGMLGENYPTDEVQRLNREIDKLRVDLLNMTHERDDLGRKYGHYVDAVKTFTGMTSPLDPDSPTDINAELPAFLISKNGLTGLHGIVIVQPSSNGVPTVRTLIEGYNAMSNQINNLVGTFGNAKGPLQNLNWLINDMQFKLGTIFLNIWQTTLSGLWGVIKGNCTITPNNP